LALNDGPPARGPNLRQRIRQFIVDLGNAGVDAQRWPDTPRSASASRPILWERVSQVESAPMRNRASSAAPSGIPLLRRPPGRPFVRTQGPGLKCASHKSGFANHRRLVLPYRLPILAIASSRRPGIDVKGKSQVEVRRRKVGVGPAGPFDTPRSHPPCGLALGPEPAPG